MMSAMKDSGVEWIGDMPVGWKLAKVKHLFNNLDNKRIPVESSARERDGKETYPYYGANGILDYIDDYIFDEDAILVGEDGSVIHEDGTPFVTVASGKFWVNNHAHVLTTRNEITVAYAAEALSVADIRKSVNGSTRQKLTQSDLGNIVLPVPPLNEQQRIVRALKNHLIKTIDVILAKIEAQIPILERYRASVIHEAVTRGLDPAVPTKPSGVSWVGSAPERWTNKRFKYVLMNGGDLRVGPFGSSFSTADYADEGESLFTQETVLSGDFGLVKKLPKSIAISLKSFEAVEGDLLITTRGTLGVVIEVPKRNKGLLHPCLMRIRMPKDHMDNRYFMYLANGSDVLKSQVEFASATTTIPVIYSSTLLNLAVPVPPIDEQRAIADYLDKRTAAIDAVLDTKRRQLDVLKRRRQSLIYEYVTGKRRVTEEA